LSAPESHTKVRDVESTMEALDALDPRLSSEREEPLS
jgi:hypothetical protein